MLRSLNPLIELFPKAAHANVAGAFRQVLEAGADSKGSLGFGTLLEQISTGVTTIIAENELLKEKNLELLLNNSLLTENSSENAVLRKKVKNLKARLQKKEREITKELKKQHAIYKKSLTQEKDRVKKFYVLHYEDKFAEAAIQANSNKKILRDNLNNEIVKLNEKLKEVEKENDKLQKDFQSKENDLQKKNASLEQEKQKLNIEIVNIDKKLEKVQKENASLKQENQKLNNEIVKLKKNLVEVEKKNQSLINVETENAKLKDTLESVKNSLSDNISSSLGSFEREKNELNKKVRKLKAFCHELFKSLQYYAYKMHWGFQLPNCFSKKNRKSYFNCPGDGRAETLCICRGRTKQDINKYKLGDFDKGKDLRADFIWLTDFTYKALASNAGFQTRLKNMNQQLQQQLQAKEEELTAQLAEKEESNSKIKEIITFYDKLCKKLFTQKLEIKVNNLKTIEKQIIEKINSIFSRVLKKSDEYHATLAETTDFTTCDKKPKNEIIQCKITKLVQDFNQLQEDNVKLKDVIYENFDLIKRMYGEVPIPCDENIEQLVRCEIFFDRSEAQIKNIINVAENKIKKNKFYGLTKIIQYINENINEEFNKLKKGNAKLKNGFSEMQNKAAEDIGVIKNKFDSLKTLWSITFKHLTETKNDQGTIISLLELQNLKLKNQNEKEQQINDKSILKNYVINAHDYRLETYKDNIQKIIAFLDENANKIWRTQINQRDTKINEIKNQCYRTTQNMFNTTQNMFNTFEEVSLFAYPADIQNASSKIFDERNKMLRLLKNFKNQRYEDNSILQEIKNQFRNRLQTVANNKVISDTFKNTMLSPYGDKITIVDINEGYKAWDKKAFGLLIWLQVINKYFMLLLENKINRLANGNVKTYTDIIEHELFKFKTIKGTVSFNYIMINNFCKKIAEMTLPPKAIKEFHASLKLDDEQKRFLSK